MDITEQLRDHTEPPLNSQGSPMYRVCYDAADLIESLRQQLDAAEANCQCELIKLEQQLAESQAAYEGYMKAKVAEMNEAIRQAKREALLEAINEWEKPYGLTDGIPFIKRLHRMADNLKD